jgi:hypothetical protein
VPRRSSRAKSALAVWCEQLRIVHGSDTLEIRVRIYPEAKVIVIEELGERNGLSAVSLIAEIALELMRICPETMDEARVFLYQPISMWTTRSRYLEWRRAIRAIDGWSSVRRDRATQ